MDVEKIGNYARVMNTAKLQVYNTTCFSTCDYCYTVVTVAELFFTQRLVIVASYYYNSNSYCSYYLRKYKQAKQPKDIL